MHEKNIKISLASEFFFNLYSWFMAHDGGEELKGDGVGPVDSRPSTDKLHHFVKKKIYIYICDTWQMTCDMWHVTCYTWHMTRDTGHIWGGEHSLKILAP